MAQEDLQIVPVFHPDDQAWIRRESVAVPSFWRGHGVVPALNDVLRFGGRQFVVEARVWEQGGSGPVLRLLLGDSHAQSDTSIGPPLAGA